MSASTNAVMAHFLRASSAFFSSSLASFGPLATSSFPFPWRSGFTGKGFCRGGDVAGILRASPLLGTEIARLTPISARRPSTVCRSMMLSSFRASSCLFINENSSPWATGALFPFLSSSDLGCRRGVCSIVILFMTSSGSLLTARLPAFRPYPSSASAAFSSGGTRSPHWNLRLALFHSGSMLLVVRRIPDSSMPTPPPVVPAAVTSAANPFPLRENSLWPSWSWSSPLARSASLWGGGSAGVSGKGGERTELAREKSPSRGLKRSEKAGGLEERRLNSAESAKGARTGEPSAPRPVRMESAKGWSGSLGRYERRSPGPEGKAVERSKRRSSASPPAETPERNGSPSTPMGTLARSSGRSSSRNLMEAFMVGGGGG
uniref:Uncharacterized protein n=1 Tax=Triticum aestivum TaxID=4565 RepID=A0A3B6MU10_WHEAT